MDPATLSALQQNLIPSSHPAIGDWLSFPWHRSNGVIDTMRVHSSQALAIDVFGTLSASTQPAKDQIAGSLAKILELQAEGPWDVQLEWTDPLNRLKETGTRSQIDALLVSPYAVICVEAKFTEGDGGCCSQPKPIATGSNAGKRQCNGNFEPQVNPVNGKLAKCSLAAKGIRYWDVAPEVMHFDAGGDYRPCPFAGSTYQWMRNLCSAYELASIEGKAAGVVVVYADALHLPMAQKVKSPAWTELTKRIRFERIGFAALGYQQLIADAAISLSSNPIEQKRWVELQTWVNRKIESTIR